MRQTYNTLHCTVAALPRSVRCLLTVSALLPAAQMLFLFFQFTYAGQQSAAFLDVLLPMSPSKLVALRNWGQAVHGANIATFGVLALNVLMSLVAVPVFTLLWKKPAPVVAPTC